MTDSSHIFPDEALPRLGDDWGLLFELFRAFQSDVPEKMALLVAAIEAGDMPAIQRNAHTIKGAAAIIGAVPCRDLAAALERCAKAHDLPGVSPAWAALQPEVAAVLKALETPPQPDSPTP